MKEHKNDIRKWYIAYNAWTRDDEYSMLVWLGLTPSRVEAFCWVAVLGKVLTTDNLRRRGLSSYTILVFALLGERRILVDHLFFIESSHMFRSTTSLSSAVFYGAVQGHCMACLMRWGWLVLRMW